MALHLSVLICKFQTGQEKTWLKDNMAYFKERAEVSRDEKFADMLEEIKHRSDLNAAL